MRTSIILILLTIKLFGQKTCNLDKYTFIENVRVDSNRTLVYYSNDDKYFIAYKKSTKDSSIKHIFEKRILNISGLLNITKAVILSAPTIETDKHGKVKYYSAPQEKFIDYPTQTFIIDEIKLVYNSKKDFTMLIKIDTGTFNQNFELKYHSDKPLKTYLTFADKFNNSTLTCINFSGTDF